ncbi:MAG: IclR family transcriptional regulator domain-containing protein [Geminicoccaceae bacterium]
MADTIKAKANLASSDPVLSGKKALTAISAGNGSEPDTGSGNARDYVSSLARGLEILRTFSRTGKRMTLSEVAVETGITRAATRRFLLTLVREGYAATDGKYFDLTPQVLELGYSVLSKIDTWDIAKPFLERLSQDVEESVSATVLDGTDVVYVSCVQFHRMISVGVAVGNRLPAYCTATGRALLAELPADEWDAVLKTIRLEPRTKHTVKSKSAFKKILRQVRDDGYALVDQELEIGLLSIAIPLRTLSGKVIGAANVGVPTVRAAPEDLIRDILPRLRETGERIASALPD